MVNKQKREEKRQYETNMGTKVAITRYFSISDKNLIEIRTKISLVSSVFDGFLIAVPF